MVQAAETRGPWQHREEGDGWGSIRSGVDRDQAGSGVFNQTKLRRHSCLYKILISSTMIYLRENG